MDIKDFLNHLTEENKDFIQASEATGVVGEYLTLLEKRWNPQIQKEMQDFATSPKVVRIKIPVGIKVLLFFQHQSAHFIISLFNSLQMVDRESQKALFDSCEKQVLLNLETAKKLAMDNMRKNK